MSLHDILNTHIFPARPLPSERRPTFDRTGGESTVTTVVDPGLVARCIIAANPVDEPDPSITFIASDLPLSSLSSLLDELIPQGAVPPPAFLNGLHYSSTLIRRDVSIDEVQQYALVSAVYFTLTSVLMDTPEIFNDGILPPASSWEMSSTPEVGTDGQLDFEIRGISPTGLACRRGIGWEYKREIVLLLRYLQTFWAATSTPQGVVMNLDESGLPTLVFPPGMHGHDHITKWCNQVVLEMDANRSDKVVLSSWDSFIFFHRVQPGFVHVTRVVTRDPSASTVRDRQGAVYTSVAHDWTPLKLVFALLLVALHPDRLQGFAHKTASHLETPSKFAKRKKSRAASTDQSLTSSASSVFPEPFSLPHLQSESLGDLCLRFDLNPLSTRRTLHDHHNRDWRSTTWCSIVPHSSSSSSSPIAETPETPPISPSPAISTKPDPLDASMTLQLKSYLSSGRLSDVFSATLGEKLVVVKLVDLETFDRNALADGYDFASAELAITREIALYLHQLAQLQDDIVARCHGVYVGQTHQPWTGLRQLRPVLALILDDVGNSIAQDWRDIPHSLRDRVREVYASLHGVGIVHRDIEPRHVRLSARGAVRLIDFEGSDFVGVGARECTDEQAHVDLLLQL